MEMDGGYIFIMANTMKEIISRNSEAKPKLIRAFSTFFVCCYSSIIIKMTSTLYLMACLMTVVVSKPYLPWMYPSMYTTNPGMTSPLMTGMFISKAVGPNAKMMFDAYNKVWGYEGDEAGEGNVNKLLF